MKPAVGFKLPSAGVTPAPSEKVLTGTLRVLRVNSVPHLRFNSKVQGLTLPREA